MADPVPPAAQTYSRRRRLLWLLLIAVGLTALVQGAVAYYAAGREADQIFDYHMQQIALALRGRVPLASSQRPEQDGEETNFDFLIQVWTPDGTPVFASEKGEELPRQPGQGFSDVTAHGTR